MKFTITHKTVYTYSDDVSLTQNHARLTPLNLTSQKCQKPTFSIFPEPDYIETITDRFGNSVTLFEIPTLHRKMTVTAISEVETFGLQEPGLFAGQMPWETVRDSLVLPYDYETLNAIPYSLATPMTHASTDMIDYIAASFTTGRPLIEACDEFMQRIYTDFEFDPQFSTVNTPLDQVFAHKKGVCQDFAHFMLACLRGIGLACRYVSGYIETLPPPGQEKLVGADASHAWISVLIPGFGWLDYDPTNNQKPFEQHVVLAVGRDFADVTPLKGVMFGGGAQQLSVSVDMARG